MDPYFCFADILDDTAAVQFSKLSASLRLLMKNADSLKTLLVVSSVHREGVSFVVRNLARVTAGTPHRKVLLIDLDYRSPSVRWGKRRTAGMSDAYLGDCELKDVVHATDTEGLFVIPGGTVQCDPHGMVSSDWFAQALRTLQGQFDLTVIDSSPVHYYSESAVLASQVSGVLFVVCAESTKREVAADALRKVEAAGGRVLGVVLNRRRHYIPQCVYRRL